MQISIRNRNYYSLSAVSFFYLFSWSAAMSFFVIWLGQEIGIGGTKIGLLYSANAIMALCMQPIFGFFSDKMGLKKNLLLGIILILLPIGPFFIYIYGPLLESYFMLGAIIGGIYLGFVFNAGYGVIDSYIDKVSRKYHFEYGRARMWGSFGWAAATWCAGQSVNIDPNITFWLATAAALLTMIALSITKVEVSELENESAKSVSISDATRLLANKNFGFLILFVVGVACVYDVYDQQFGVYFVSQFSSQDVGNEVFGNLGAIQVFFEALFLFIAPWIANKLGAKKTLIIAGTIMSLRIVGSSFEFGPVWIGIMKFIHSFEKPLFLVAVFKYISLNFDLRLTSTVFLGYLFSNSISAAILSPLFGRMYETIGFSQSYFYIGIAAGMFTLISSRTLVTDKMSINYSLNFKSEKVEESTLKKAQ